MIISSFQPAVTFALTSRTQKGVPTAPECRSLSAWGAADTDLQAAGALIPSLGLSCPPLIQGVGARPALYFGFCIHMRNLTVICLWLHVVNRAAGWAGKCSWHSEVGGPGLLLRGLPGPFGGLLAAWEVHGEDGAGELLEEEAGH